MMWILEYEINTLYSSQGQNTIYITSFGLVRIIWKEIQKAILKVRIQGLERERTAIFLSDFVIKDGLKRNLNQLIQTTMC